MSTIFDVTSVKVEGNTDVVLSSSPMPEISITDTSIPQVTLQVQQAVETVQVAVEGPQGPPGVQNLFVSSTPPQNPKINDIWIQI